MVNYILLYVHIYIIKDTQYIPSIPPMPPMPPGGPPAYLAPSGLSTIMHLNHHDV